MKGHITRPAAWTLALLLGLCLVAPVLAGDYPTKKELVQEAKGCIQQIEVSGAGGLMDGGCLFLDCREPAEYAQGHVPGAMNIPRGLLEFKIAKAVPDRTAKVVIYCKTGGRGSLATASLQRMGYVNAVNLDGGWKAWAAAGLPAEASAVPVATAQGVMDKHALVKEAKGCIQEVDIAQARDMMADAGNLFLDCREPGEYAQGHIPGALNIPRGLLEFKIAEAVPDKAARIVVYCKTGGRGSLSTMALCRMGYTNVVNLDGGWKAWKAAGFPAEASAVAAQTAQGELSKHDLVREAKTCIEEVDVARAGDMMAANGCLFLDCREPGEYAQGHIPGALNIPRGLLEFKIAEAVPDKSMPLVVYCKTGGRGSLSTVALRRMGYVNAVNLDGGWKAWSGAGQPVESSPEAAAASAAPRGEGIEGCLNPKTVAMAGEYGLARSRIASFDRQLSDRLLRFGDVAMHRGRAMEAKRYFWQALLVDPTSPSAWRCYDQAVLNGLADQVGRMPGLVGMEGLFEEPGTIPEPAVAEVEEGC